MATFNEVMGAAFFAFPDVFGFDAWGDLEYGINHKLCKKTDRVDEGEILLIAHFHCVILTIIQDESIPSEQIKHIKYMIEMMLVKLADNPTD